MNFVAQELVAHGFGREGALYYYNSKRIGEVDFLVEQDGKVLPIEAKSGDDCETHVALDKLMTAREYGIPMALVLNKFGNVRRVGGLSYLPVYFLMFLKADVLPDRLIYRVDA